MSEMALSRLCRSPGGTMNKLMLEPTTQAQWYALVQDAVTASGVLIDEELEHYLVLLLMRFAQQPELISRALAIDFLQSHHESAAIQHDMLRDVGDKCLLFSGLFPGRAQRRHTRVSYFVSLGQSAYGTLAGLSMIQLNQLYASLQEEFVSLMDVLLATRTMHGHPSSLSPLAAHELWDDTGSRQAYLALQQLCQEIPDIAREEDTNGCTH